MAYPAYPPFIAPAPEVIAPIDPVTLFRAAAERAGIQLPAHIAHTDGKIQRFSTKKDNPKDDGGWYTYHTDGLPAGAAGDWRTGAKLAWHAQTLATGEIPSVVQQTEARQRIEEAKRKAEAEQKTRHEAAAKTAIKVVTTPPCPDALRDNHKYLIRKNVKCPDNAVILPVDIINETIGYTPQSKGIKLEGDILCLPVSDLTGNIQTVEFIDESGRKSALSGGKKSEACWFETPAITAPVVIVGEGFATVWTAEQATGYPSVAALSASNLPVVAGLLRKANPTAKILILADIDGQPPTTCAYAITAARLVNGILALPPLPPGQRGDWADFYAEAGAAATESAIQAIITPNTPSEPVSQADTTLHVDAAPPEQLQATSAITQHDIDAEALREAIRRTEGITDPLARAMAQDATGKLFGIRDPVAYIQKAERARPVFPTAPLPLSLRSTSEERETARLTPTSILPGFFYADVGILSGSGGTGKTTLALWEMLHLVTARPLYGQVIERPGPVLFVTGEDSRAVVLARLNRIIEAVEPSLNDVEREAVDAGFAIWDVSSDAARLVDIDRTGRIAPTGFADEIITVCQALQPVMVTFDPLISFMPSETRVNDAEQSIIIEARRIVRKTDAMVRFITHVSQNSYRAGVTDQYAARGGTALPDGCRMVSVLTRVLDDSDTPPKTLKTEPDYVVFKLHRPKLSYTPPQPAVWISRAGYRFDFSAELPALPPAAQKAADAHQVLRFLASELSEGRRYTQRAIEDCRDELGMGRDQIRRAITEAQVAGKLKAEPLPPDERQGSRTTFLCPVYCANPPAQ